MAYSNLAEKGGDTRPRGASTRRSAAAALFKRIIVDEIPKKRRTARAKGRVIREQSPLRARQWESDRQNGASGPAPLLTDPWRWRSSTECDPRRNRRTRC